MLTTLKVKIKELHAYMCFYKLLIQLIGKDGDDVIDNITCKLTGTESIIIHKLNTHTEFLRVKCIKL